MVIAYNREGKKIIVDAYPKQRYISFRVLKNNKVYYTKSLQYTGQTDDDEEIKKQKFYRPIIEDLKRHIIPIDPDNLGDNSDFENYGTANGWKEKSEHTRPKMLNEKLDREKNPYLCVYEIQERLGNCWTRIINYTYKYIFDYDSSD